MYSGEIYFIEFNKTIEYKIECGRTIDKVKED